MKSIVLILSTLSLLPTSVFGNGRTGGGVKGATISYHQSQIAPYGEIFQEPDWWRDLLADQPNRPNFHPCFQYIMNDILDGTFDASLEQIYNNSNQDGMLSHPMIHFSSNQIGLSAHDHNQGRRILIANVSSSLRRRPSKRECSGRLIRLLNEVASEQSLDQALSTEFPGDHSDLAIEDQDLTEEMAAIP